MPATQESFLINYN